MKKRVPNLESRIEDKLEVQTYIDRLQYAIINNSAKIEYQVNRRVDNNRDLMYTNKYTIGRLFPNESPVKALKRVISLIELPSSFLYWISLFRVAVWLKEKMWPSLKKHLVSLDLEPIIQRNFLLSCLLTMSRTDHLKHGRKAGLHHALKSSKNFEFSEIVILLKPIFYHFERMQKLSCDKLILKE